MSNNYLPDYFILCFLNKYPNSLNDSDKNNIRYLFDSQIKKFYITGIDYCYYVRTFVDRTFGLDIISINEIIGALAVYFSSLDYLKNYPLIISFINVSNNYDINILGINGYFDALNGSLNNIKNRLSDEDIKIILKLCPVFTNYLESHKLSLYNFCLLYPNLQMIVNYFLKSKGLKIIVNYDLKKNSEEKTKIQQQHETKAKSRKIITKNNKFQKKETKPFCGFYQTFFNLIDYENTKGLTNDQKKEIAYKFNYIIHHLNYPEANRILSTFGMDFHYTYNSSSESFTSLIKKCELLKSLYEKGYLEKYINFDFNQNFYYILKGYNHDLIFEALYTLSKDQIKFLANYYDLENGLCLFDNSLENEDYFKLGEIFSAIENYVAYYDNPSKCGIQFVKKRN